MSDDRRLLFDEDEIFTPEEKPKGSPKAAEIINALVGLEVKAAVYDKDSGSTIVLFSGGQALSVTDVQKIEDVAHTISTIIAEQLPQAQSVLHLNEVWEKIKPREEPPAPTAPTLAQESTTPQPREITDGTDRSTSAGENNTPTGQGS